MDARARKIADTMRERRIDNFKVWRDRMKAEGRIKAAYMPLERNGDLAELIGVVLGDGHIHAHARCESLRIVGSGDNPGFAMRYASLVKAVFGKEPHVARRSNANAINITIYEKYISTRIGIPSGHRGDHAFVLPRWIARSKQNRIRFLRGLYEAEGSISHHEPTYTHKLFFSNRNGHLLQLVTKLVTDLGYVACLSGYQVQVSRKADVQKLSDLLEFRHYSS